MESDQSSNQEWDQSSDALIVLSNPVEQPPITQQSPITFDAGIFTVHSSGRIRFAFRAEDAVKTSGFAVFSLSDMDAFQPGTQAYVEEAIRRSLTQSALGHVLLPTSLPSETTTIEQEIELEAGSPFAVVWIPNGTLAEYATQAAEGSEAPVFSIPAANLSTIAQFGQVINESGETVFAIVQPNLDLADAPTLTTFAFRITGGIGQTAPLDLMASLAWTLSDEIVGSPESSPIPTVDANSLDEIATDPGALPPTIIEAPALESLEIPVSEEFEQLEEAVQLEQIEDHPPVAQGFSALFTAPTPRLINMVWSQGGTNRFGRSNPPAIRE